MIVTIVPIEWHPRPWEEERQTVAYVAAGPEPGQLGVVRGAEDRRRFFDALDRWCASAPVGGVAGLRRAVPDAGTSLRFSEARTVEAESYEAALTALAASLGKP